MCSNLPDSFGAVLNDAETCAKAINVVKQRCDTVSHDSIKLESGASDVSLSSVLSHYTFETQVTNNCSIFFRLLLSCLKNKSKFEIWKGSLAIGNV